jgi:plasmid stabilization system protein ParE
MKRPVILDPEARSEFDEAYDFYESRRTGLGEQFSDAVQTVLDRISANPKTHGVVVGHVRRGVVRGYPYCVYYREEQSTVRVLAVFHTSRDPADWLRRV